MITKFKAYPVALHITPTDPYSRQSIQGLNGEIGNTRTAIRGGVPAEGVVTIAVVIESAGMPSMI